MFRRKQDVDKHVSSILSRKRDEKEKLAQGFQIARLYSDIKEYAIAKRYLSGFLHIRENVPQAHQLMGEINEALGEKDEAIENYKRALNLGSNGSSNKQLYLKICELYCEQGTDIERMKYWCDQCEKLYPKNDVVFKLKAQIAEASNGELSNAEEMENLIVSEILNRPTDLKLRIRLSKLYLDSQRYEEAYDAAIATDLTTAFIDRLPWFEHLQLVFKLYAEKFPGCKTDLVYSMHSLHVLRNILSLSLGGKEVDDCEQHLLRFDQELKVAASLTNQEEEWLALLQEMKGQFFFLAGLVLLKKAQMGSISWQDVNELCGACFLVSRNIDPIDAQAPWFVKLPQGHLKFYNWWHLQSYDRLSQVGHMLLQLSVSDFTPWSRDLRLSVMTTKGRQRVFKALYSSQDVKSLGEDSYLYQAREMVDTSEPKEPLSARLMIDIDRVASQIHLSSLSHLVWLCLQRYSYEMNAQPNYHFSLLENLQYSTKNINTGAAESLCQLDILVFLLATVQCTASAAADRSPQYEENKGRPALLPVCLSKPLCTHDQEEWWAAAYKFSINSVKDDFSRLRRVLVRGIETIRLIGPHGVSVAMITHIARSLDVKAKSLRQAEYGSRIPPYDLAALESRAVFYWDKAKQALHKLQRNHNSPIPKNRLFKETRDIDVPPRLVDKYMAEAVFALSLAAMKDHQYETALEGFESHRSVWAKFHCAQIYKALAERGSEVEDVPTDFGKNQVYLLKAREYLFDVMDMLDGDRDHELNVLVTRELDDLEMKIHDMEMINLKGSPLQTPIKSPPGRGSSAINGIGSSTPRNLPTSSWSHTTNRLVESESISEMNHSLRDHSASGHDLSRPRPSPERLDLQIKSLSYSQASLFKMVMDRNEELIMINGKMMEELRDNNNQLKNILSENKTLMEELKTFLGENRDMMKQIKTELASLKPNLVQAATGQVSPATPLFVSHMPQAAPPPRGPFQGFPAQTPVVPMAYGNFAVNSTVPAQAAPVGPQYCPTGLPGLRTSNVGKYRPQSEEDEEEDLSNIDDETSAMYRDCLDPDQSFTQFFTPESQLMQDLSHTGRSGIESQPAMQMPPTFQPRMSIPAGYFASALRGQSLQYAQASQTPGQVKPRTPGPGFFSTPPAVVVGPAGSASSSGIRMPLAVAPNTPILAVATPGSVDSSQSPAIVSALTGQHRSITTGMAKPEVSTVMTTANQGSMASCFSTATSKTSGSITPTTSTTEVKNIPFGQSTSKESGKFLFGGLTFSSTPTIESVTDKEREKVEAQKVVPGVSKAEAAKPFAGFSLTATTSTIRPDIKSPADSTKTSIAGASTPVLSPSIGQRSQGSATTAKSPGVSAKGEEDHVEDYEPNVDFKPVITLPKLVDKKTGEENEIEVFVDRCRLFRFDPETSQWKERGVGELKILRSKDQVKFRIIMRREQILKLCANHFLKSDMRLAPMATSDRAWCYYASDFSEELIKHEQLAVKFKTADKAKMFQEVFCDCCQQLKDAEGAMGTGSEDRMTTSTADHSPEPSGSGVSGGSASSSNQPLSELFKPKAGSWECGGCLLRNNENLVKCPACNAAKPGYKPASGASTPLSEMFKPKEGSWECGSCLVRNGGDLSKCAACGAMKPGAGPASTAKDKPGAGFAFASKITSGPPETGFKFGSATTATSNVSTTGTGFVFKGPEVSSGFKFGQAASTTNVPITTATTAASGFVFKGPDASTGFTFSTATTTASVPTLPTTTTSGFKGPAVTSSSTSVFGGFKFGTTTTRAVTTTTPATSGFKFSASATTVTTSSTTAVTSTSGFFFKPTTTTPSIPSAAKAGASNSKPGFTFGSSALASTTSSVFATTTSTTTAASAGFNLGSTFSFSTPNKTGPGNQAATPSSGGLLAKLLTSDDNSAADGQGSKPKPTAGFSFVMPPKTSTSSEVTATSSTSSASSGFQFSFTKTPPKGQGTALVPGSPEVDEHGMYVNKEEDDSHIHFEPLISLPEKFEVKTGEEDEDILFESRGKMYRFVSGEWKEKGVGVVKILQHRLTKKTRVLMRRDQVLKICCNHTIEPALNLQPMPRSEGKAWVWYAMDFSEDEGKMEQLALRFRIPDAAAEFKRVFDQCREQVQTSPSKAEHSSHQDLSNATTGQDEDSVDSSDDVIYLGEDVPTPELVARARQYLLPDTFYLYENKPPCPGCLGCEDGERTTDESPSGKPAAIVESTKAKESTPKDIPVFGSAANLPDFASLTSDGGSEKKGGSFVFGSGASMDFSSLAATGKASDFAWKKTDSSSPFKFAGAGQKLFGAAASGGETHEEDGDDSGVAPSGDIHFEPVIPLPDLVQVKTGEEDWTSLFCHRAKLYKFDKQVSQWKERGVGDIKIMSHNTKPLFRILQRREQVLKVSCNHLITGDMELKPMATSETSWCWVANDLTESEPSVEQFAVKFKAKETALEFKKAFETCKEALLSKNRERPQQSSVQQQHSSLQPQQQAKQEAEDSYNEDDHGEGHEEYEDEEDEEENEDEVLFEKRVTLNVFEDGEWKKLSTGNLQVTYDEDLNGNKLRFIGDDGYLKCSHVICSEHSVSINQNICEWHPLDFLTDEPIRKHFRAAFSSGASAKEFANLFSQSVTLAIESGISEKFPNYMDEPVIFSKGEQVPKG